MTVADLLTHIRTLSRFDKLQLMQFLATELLRDAAPPLANPPQHQTLQRARHLRETLSPHRFTAADIDAAIQDGRP
jgi:hypothetical protein